MTSNGNCCHCVTALFLIHLIEIFCYKRIFAPKSILLFVVSHNSELQMTLSSVLDIRLSQVTWPLLIKY